MVSCRGATQVSHRDLIYRGQMLRLKKIMGCIYYREVTRSETIT